LHILEHFLEGLRASAWLVTHREEKVGTVPTSGKFPARLDAQDLLSVGGDLGTSRGGQRYDLGLWEISLENTQRAVLLAEVMSPARDTDFIVG
jgi:hypothetical protein